MHNQIPFSRRGFLFSLIAIPFTLVTKLAFAAKETVTSTVADATKALVTGEEPMPKALHYTADATKASARTNAKSTCSNCVQYLQAVGADGKPIKVAGALVGGCKLFNMGKSFVKSSGWCMSWIEASA